jgi:predicted Zn-dependent protease
MVLVQEPLHSDAHNLIAVIDWEMGDREQALTRLEHALALNAAKPDIQLNIALMREAMGRTTEAISGLQSFLRDHVSDDLSMELARLIGR